MSNDSQLAIRGGSAALSLVPQNYEKAFDFAERVMANSGLVPSHLQKKPADCFLVLMQAMEWGMNPLAVAQKTSVISGRLMYEGQLVAAVINTRLEQSLDYTFAGTSDDRTLTVTGKLPGWSAARTIELTLREAKQINKNGQIHKQPDQQMCYIGARIWCRRHTPEVLLGIYSPDERMNDDEPLPVVETPARPPVPRKAAKGAAALDVVATAPVETVPPATAADVVVEPDLAPAAEPTVPPPAEPTPPAAAPAPVGTVKIHRGAVLDIKKFPAKNTAGITEVIGASISGLEELGWIFFDPERPELAPFAKATGDRCEFTIESKPSPSNPQVIRQIITKVVAVTA